MPFQEENFTVKWDESDADADGDGDDESELPDSGPSEAGDEDEYEQSGGDGVYLTIGLDEDHNEGKTTFCPGDDAFLIVYHSPGQDVAIGSAIGNIKEKLTSVPIEIEEVINCDNSSSINLRYEPVGNIAITWAPPVSTAFTISGRTVTLAQPVFSIATITYETLTDIWMLNGITEESSVRVLANMGETTSAMTVSFLCDAEDTPDGELVDETVEAYDCTTGDPVSGVKIWIEGQYQGSTNSSGICSIGERTVGEVLTVRWTYKTLSGEVEKTV